MPFAVIRENGQNCHPGKERSMSKIGSKMKLLSVAGLMFVVSLGAASLQGSPAGLTPAESDGYLQWLHSLEKAVTVRLESDLPEANLLFPFDLEAWDLDDPRPYRHLSISKAVTELEAQWNNRGNGNINSALMALANARNYVNLSEYDSALVWYNVAAQLDSNGSFRREIAREGLACATSANDSLAIAQLMTNTLGSSDLEGRADELILAFRWLLTEQDSESLAHLIQKINAHPSVQEPRLEFWQAYSLSWLGRPEESLVHLRQLVQTGGLSHALSESQRSWVLVGMANTYFLLGDTNTARDLYKTLSSSRVQELRMWGTYQIAGLDFIDNNYLRAGNGFQEVCESTRFGSWQDQACAMKDIAVELERIKSEGEPYGVADYYSP